VCFALNNGQFETVVSADDGGFIAVWDIEDGHLMSKFGNTHGPYGSKTKITAGCFDSKQLRLATAGSDGTVLIWNFSNGQDLTKMIDSKNGKRVDTEITKMCCVFDPDDP
jgi:WD40 repeat protein